MLFTIITSKTGYYPIIAIVSLTDPANQVEIETTNVMLHFVKWIEDAGGLSIAIHPWMSDGDFEDMFLKVNWFLFQWGERDLVINGQFEQFSKRIIDRII